MLDFPVAPPIIVKDTPHPRTLRTLNEARSYVAAMLKVHRPPVWRDTLRRLEDAKTEDQAIEAIGALRELLTIEDMIAA
jgi:flagellar biosynthesis regulator FlbT